MLKLGLFTAVLTSTLLAGCAAFVAMNPFFEEPAAQKEAASIAVASSACERYGLKPSTDAFALCVQAEVDGNKTREAIAAAARK